MPSGQVGGVLKLQEEVKIAGLQACAVTSTLHEIADFIGWPAIVKLFEAYKGRDHFRVPMKMTEDHPIAEALGIEEAENLSKYAGGSRIDVIGSDLKMQRLMRNARIDLAVQDFSKSIIEIALENGVTSRWVRLRAAQLGCSRSFGGSAGRIRPANGSGSKAGKRSLTASELLALPANAAPAAKIAKARAEGATRIVDIANATGLSAEEVKRVRAISRAAEAEAQSSLKITHEL